MNAGVLILVFITLAVISALHFSHTPHTQALFNEHFTKPNAAQITQLESQARQCASAKLRHYDINFLQLHSAYVSKSGDLLIASFSIKANRTAHSSAANKTFAAMIIAGDGAKYFTSLKRVLAHTDSALCVHASFSSLAASAQMNEYLSQSAKEQ